MSEKVPAKFSRPLPPPPALPEGWIAVWDEECQRYYYANSSNQVTQWDVPALPTNVAARSPPPEYSATSSSPVAYMQPAYVDAPIHTVQTVPVQTIRTVPVHEAPMRLLGSRRGFVTGLVVGSIFGGRGGRGGRGRRCRGGRRWRGGWC